MVDIIVPVYNAYEDLRLCVDSVFRHTDLQKNRLIFVNDCSSDSRIAPYLDSLKGDNVLVHHNERNKGFSANVNYGIQCSENNDVLLLNTDTIVTKGWLDKITACAMRDPHIASVTPLSNRAEICSVPNYLEQNDIPNGYTIDTFAELVEHCSLHRYPQIPVAIGYCMYIPRAVLKKVGLFDAETFQRGYGEENDFCNRAILLGYYNVMCDDTFIYHSGCASFREARTELCIEHEKILRQRYPDIMRQLDIYLRENPNRIIQENIKLHLALETNRQNLLMVSHRDFFAGSNDSVGGVQLHMKDLVKKLRQKYNIIVAARDKDMLALAVYGQQYQYRWNTYIGNEPETPELHNLKMFELFKNIMTTLKVDLVHIQHTKGLTLEPFFAAEALNLPTICTLHDYYYACPTVKCICSDGQFCQLSTDLEFCQSCLEDAEKIGFDSTAVPNFLENWRGECKRALASCEVLVAPSENTKRYYEKVFPDLDRPIHVIPHGIDILSTQANLTRKHNGEKLRVAFVGGISYDKGGKVAHELVNAMPDIRFYVIGSIGERRFADLEMPNLKKIGPYSRDALPGILRRYKIDLVCIPSIWAETFCYTLSESVACGIPALCFDLGAQGERVNRYGYGWAVPLETGSDGMATQIREIQKDMNKYEEALARCVDSMSYGTAEMSEQYASIYESQVKEHCANKRYDFANLLKMQGNTDSGASAMAARIEELTAKLYEIETAPSYQMMLRIRKNIPLKRQIKKILGLSE